MSDTVRLDKWLWAARFFRSRSLAKQAIESGKVRCDGARTKVSKELRVGTVLQIRQGWDERTIEVLALSEQRRGASEAAKLFRESEASINAREARAAERRALNLGQPTRPGRPSKRDRRQIERFLSRSPELPDEG